MMTKTKYGIMLLLLSATALLTGCNNDDSNENADGSGNNISFSTNLQPFQSKASTFDSYTDMQTEGRFTCTAYIAGETTEHIAATPVVWSSGTDWQFANDTYQWPSSGNFDFFAYMPATKPDYISSISYTTARIPQFVCSSMPMTDAGQEGLKEFIWALSIDKNKSNSSSGVAMTFKHAFAKITFRVGNPASDGVTINSVTLSALKTGGNCSFDGITSAWSSQTGSTDLVGKVGTPYIIIPYNYTSGLTITANATWSNISNATADTKAVAVDALKCNFQPGYSYIYTLTLDGTALKVDVDKYTVEQW